MGRQRTIDQAQLFRETEKLILEEGYAGFHYKALAERLGVARSTIYNYYARKEELITDYMVHLVEEALKQMEDAEQCEDPVHRLLEIWSRYATMHQMLQIMPYIDTRVSEKVERSVGRMYVLFGNMKQVIGRVLEAGQMEGRIRTDIELPVITGLLMATVQIPVYHNQLDDWVEDVYRLVMDGVRSKT